MSQATDNMIAKYAAETRAAFMERVQDDQKANLILECVKREYANASNVDRACWDGNPFEEQNDRDGIDYHAAGCSHDRDGFRIL